MKVSLNWVAEFVDVRDFFSKPEELGALLTRAGLEVEDIQNQKLKYQHVVIGHVIEKGQHPNADRLSLCKVNVGSDDQPEVLQIVCGAQNHKTGDKVVAAKIGAVLPGDFKIQKSKIRSVESFGMLCSFKELGMPVDGDGIIILPANAVTGKNIADHYGLDDVLFELKVTPNRADCLSHYGLAREIGCILNREVALPTYEYKTKATANKMKVKVTDGHCSRYCGRIIENISVGPSPEWLSRRLEKLGFKSINNIVDVTNYVMLELGQPMHAFDLDQIKGDKIIIRKAEAKEKFVTLDGTELLLSSDDLVISDQDRSLALAGVVGGANSGISNSTKNIYLESAYFSQEAVRRTSRKYGVQTESCYRFSRGVDSSGCIQAIYRASALIAKLCADAQIDANPTDSDHRQKRTSEISVSLNYLSERIGYAIDENKFEDYLHKMKCKFTKIVHLYKVMPPEFRFDLEQEVDFVEEYARLYGYEHLPESLPVFRSSPTPHDPHYLFSLKISEILRAMGSTQAFHFSFCEKKKEDEWIGPVDAWNALGVGYDQSGGAQVQQQSQIQPSGVQILNPLSEELNQMRKSLSFGLYKSCKTNISQMNLQGSLFEVGKVFWRAQDFHEGLRLGLVQWGQSVSFWQNKKLTAVHEVKGVLEEMFKNLNMMPIEFKNINKASLPFLHPFQSAEILFRGKTIGFFGNINPALLDEDKIRQEVVVAELNLAPLMELFPAKSVIKPISKIPMVERDLAFIAEKTVSVGSMMKEMRGIIGARFVEMEVFDIFESESLGKNERSIAFRMKLQDSSATLTDDELLKLQDLLIQKMQTKFNCRLR